MALNKRALIIGVSIATLLAGASVFAGRANHNHSERIIERVSDRLDLNEGQRSDLEQLHSELREMHTLLHGDREELTQELQQMLNLASFDQSAALAMIEQRTQAVQNNAPDLVNAAAVFMDGLSVEQKADISAFIEKHSSRHRH